MNYFNELLESYDKLKKRKFKLVYLEEQDGVAPNIQDPLTAAKEAMRTAKDITTLITIPNGIPIGSNGKIVAYTSKKDKALSPGLALADQKGRIPGSGNYSIKISTLELDKEAQKKIGEIILFGSEVPQNPDAQQPQNTEQQQEQLPPQEVPEVAPEVDKPFNNITSLTLQNLYNEMMEFNKKNPNSPFKNMRGYTGRGESTGEVFAGSGKTSIPYRLKAADYLVYNEDIEKYEKKEISEDLLDNAIDSYAALVRAALKSSEEVCEEVADSIKLVLGKDEKKKEIKKILYKTNADENDDGILMDLKAIDTALLSQAIGNCSGLEEETTTIPRAHGGAKSSVKGALAESMIDFTFVFKRFQSKNLNKKEREDMSRFLALSIKNKLDSIKLLVEDMQKNSSFSTDLEAAFIEEVLTEEYMATSSIAQAREYLSKELLHQRKMVDEFFPNSICALNTASEGAAQTGERSDRKFIYTDRKLAVQDFLRKNTSLTEDQISLEEVTLGQIIQLIDQKCTGKAACTYRDQFNLMLEAGGLKGKSNKTKLFLVAVGLKRYGVLDKVTLGSIDSFNRMDDIFTQNNSTDTRLAEGFVDSTFDKLDMDEKSKQEMLGYQQKLQKELNNIQTLISSNYTIANDDKPDFSNSIEVCKRLNDILKTNSKKNDKRFKTIIKLFNRAEKLKKDDKGVLIDKSKVIPRLVKKIQKMIIIKRAQDSLEKNDPRVRGMLLAQLLLTGSTKDENMYQSMTDDSGSTKVIKHNEIFNTVLQAEKSKNLKIIATDAGVRFSLINNSNIFIDLKIDTTNGYIAKLPKTSIDALNLAKPNLSESVYQIQEDLLQEVFVLQEKIIKFMNQGK